MDKYEKIKKIGEGSYGKNTKHLFLVFISFFS
jgi:hypothetical protein